MRKREHRYEVIGYRPNNGRFLAYTECNDCGGRGFTGFNRTTKKIVACKCVITIPLPIDYIILTVKK